MVDSILWCQVAAFDRTVQSAMDSLRSVVDDVHPEYCELSPIARRLMQFKGETPAAYRDANLSRLAPALFAPYVRLQLVSWRPLQAPRITAMQWVRELASYGNVSGRQMDDDDEDGDMVPLLVQEVVLPLVQEAAHNEWDPYSSRSTRQLIALWHELVAFCEVGSVTCTRERYTCGPFVAPCSVCSLSPVLCFSLASKI